MDLYVISVVLRGDQREYALALKLALEQMLEKDGVEPNIRVNHMRVPVK